jgi:hypothetical protein
MLGFFFTGSTLLDLAAGLRTQLDLDPSDKDRLHPHRLDDADSEIIRQSNRLSGEWNLAWVGLGTVSALADMYETHAWGCRWRRINGTDAVASLLARAQLIEFCQLLGVCAGHPFFFFFPVLLCLLSMLYQGERDWEKTQIV